MIRIPTFAAWFLILLVAAGCARTLPIHNVSAAPVLTSSGNAVTDAEVKDAITAAAQSKGWIVEQLEGNRMLATVTVRRHKAVVTIDYSAEQYSITYKSSVRLLHDGNMIHRNYNKWVKLLDERIRQNINAL